MAMDLKWLLSADDKASSVFDKVKATGESTAKGIEGAFSGAMGKFNLLTGVVGGMMAVAAGGAFSKVIKETIEWTGEAVALSKALGITTQQASVLNLALGDVYLSKETMLAGSSRIAKTLKTEEEAFTKLGVATRDQSGHYRSTLDIMTDVNTKLGTLREGTDRNIAGMSIYGKSWGELSGLIKLNSQVMKDAEEKAKRLGLEVGEESVKNAKKYKAALNDIEDVGKSLAIRFGNVLLPMLVKVGAFLGNNGPLLSDVFRWSLNALGFTINTLGEYLGLLAFRAYSTFGIIKSALSGNFGEAKNQFSAMVAAGDDFNARTKANWAADWSKDKDITSKAIEGGQITPDDGKAEAAAQAAAEKKKTIWLAAAKHILDAEKDSLSKRLDQEKEYLKQVQGLYADHVKELDTFREQAQGIRDKIAARNQAGSDAAAALRRGPEDGYQKYYRQQAELQNQLNAIENSPGWSSKTIIEKAQKYNDLIEKAQTYFDTIKAEGVENISQDTAERNLLITRQTAEERISTLLSTQESKLEAIAIKDAEAVTAQEKKVQLMENQMNKLDAMIKNIPSVTEKEIRIKITGLDQLYQIQSIMNGGASTTFNKQGGMSAADYYQSGDSMYWGDGSYAGPALARGTNYVPADGPAYLHKGEAVIPAEFNTGSGATMSFGDVNFTLPNVTNQTSAAELMRQLMPELQKLQQRYRKAA